MTNLSGKSLRGTHAHTPLPDNPEHLSRGYGAGASSESYMMTGGIDARDHADATGNVIDSSPLSQTISHPRRETNFNEEFDLPTRGGSIVDGGTLSRANSTRSQATTAVQTTPSRGGTLKKKSSVSRKASLKRSGSRRLSRSASAVGLDGERGIEGDELHSAFYTPVPTDGIPTVVLAERFESMQSPPVFPTYLALPGRQGSAFDDHG